MNRKCLFYWVGGIILAAILIGAAFYFDEAMRAFVAQHQNRTVKIFMRNISRLGDWTEHFAAGVGLLGLAWWWRSRKWTRVFSASELSARFTEQLTRKVWDTKELLANYAELSKAVSRSAERLNRLPEERALVESFRLGGSVIQ